VSDEIVLRLPRERPFFGVAHLVLGGLAVRLDLSFEQLEDVQVALAELLERQEDGHDVTVAVAVEGDVLRATIGPFDDTLAAELERDGGPVGLRRVLATVVDSVDLTDRDGRPWVVLTKTVSR
jgi:hypothetical protein